MGKILAIDYGMKRTGIAITDGSKIFATGLTTVATNEIYVFLTQLMKDEEIETIVVGKPMNLQNLPTDATKPSDTLAKKIGKLFTEIKVERVDERFTSKLAKQAMFAGGMKKKDRRDKKMIDKISATIILQSYLDSQSYSYLKE
ncbi:Holliday junction resolvase RuvX [Flavobacteriales bacterium]|nr:Holliday junction resolvase RuvX [Flavobacteriales bacterium]